jgi:hypothetical protein
VLWNLIVLLVYAAALTVFSVLFWAFLTGFFK